MELNMFYREAKSCFSILDCPFTTSFDLVCRVMYFHSVMCMHRLSWWRLYHWENISVEMFFSCLCFSFTTKSPTTRLRGSVPSFASCLILCLLTVSVRIKGYPGHQMEIQGPAVGKQICPKLCCLGGLLQLPFQVPESTTHFLFC